MENKKVVGKRQRRRRRRGARSLSIIKQDRGVTLTHSVVWVHNHKRREENRRSLIESRDLLSCLLALVIMQLLPPNSPQLLLDPVPTFQCLIFFFFFSFFQVSFLNIVISLSSCAYVYIQLRYRTNFLLSSRQSIRVTRRQLQTRRRCITWSFFFYRFIIIPFGSRRLYAIDWLSVGNGSSCLRLSAFTKCVRAQFFMPNRYTKAQQ